MERENNYGQIGGLLYSKPLNRAQRIGKKDKRMWLCSMQPTHNELVGTTSWAVDFLCIIL